MDKPIKIELGCGDRKRDPESIGIDLLALEGVDIVGDALASLKDFEEASIAEVFSHHVLEHLPYLKEIIDEIERVLTPGGVLTCTVPHYSNPFFYSDPTHRVSFGLYTFSYLCEDGIFRRRVPGYIRNVNLELIDVYLTFKSFRPRYLTFGIRKVAEKIFNMSRWAQEVYEDSFSNYFRCYEITFTVRKRIGNSHDRDGCSPAGEIVQG